MTSESPSFYSPSSSSSTQLPIHSTFPLLRKESTSLLVRCIRFLRQSDRVRAACANKYMYQVCGSAESWVSDEMPSALESCALKSDPHFYSYSLTSSALSPAVSCGFGQLLTSSQQSLFRQARCIHVKKGGQSLGNMLGYLSEWPRLEHLYISDIAAHLRMIAKMPKLPTTLRSLTFVHTQIPNAPLETEPSDSSKLLSILPDSLESLQIIIYYIQHQPDKNSIALELDLETTLLRLPNLKRLSILSPQCKGPLRVFPVPILREWISELPQHKNLQIFSDAYVPNLSMIPTLQQQSFLAAVVHLHIRQCGIFQSPLAASPIDIASYFPNLSSMHIDLFGASKDAGANLPQGLGAKIKSLMIHAWVFDENTLQGDTFAIHGLTNLTSLNLVHACPQPLSAYDSLVTLTHLSIPVKWDRHSISLTDFEKMRNLRSIEMHNTRWQSYLQKDSRTHPLEWNQIEDAIKNDATCSSSALPISDESSAVSLAAFFPALTELTVLDDRPVLPGNMCYEARNVLQTIPNLRSIKWGSEPQLHPSQIEAYYSADAIYDREVRALRLDNSSLIPQPPKANSEAMMEEIPSTSSTIARHFNTFNLSLAFQSLTPVEVARASTVSKHWRNAALSPLVLRHHIRVEMHQLQGAKVHGPQIRIGTLWPMIQACNSAVFRNLRILNISIYEGPALSRESGFARKYLRLFMCIPQFASLHTLALNWQLPNKFEPFVFPSLGDIESIKSVMESTAMKHLKVFRIMAFRTLVCFMCKFLPRLKGLEVIELRNVYDDGVKPDQSCKFAHSLLQIPSLKHLYVADYGTNTYPAQLDELREFCNGVSDRFEEVMWRVSTPESILIEIAARHRADPSFCFPHLKSMHILSLYNSLNTLSDASDALPHLDDVSIGSIDDDDPTAVAKPLPARLASRLKSLKLKIQSRYDRKGPLVLTVMEQLCASNLSALECLHIFRNFSAAETDAGLDERINQALCSIIHGSPNLTELNCPSFTLGGASKWDPILPQLRIVYGHPMITPYIERCQQLREYHSPVEPSRNLIVKLLALSYFQLMTMKNRLPHYMNQDSTTTLTRAQLVRSHAESQLRSSGSQEIAKRAQQLMESSTTDYQSLASSWQRLNEIAKRTPAPKDLRTIGTYGPENDDDDDDEVRDERQKKRTGVEPTADASNAEDQDLALILSSLASS